MHVNGRPIQMQLFLSHIEITDVAFIMSETAGSNTVIHFTLNLDIMLT